MDFLSLWLLKRNGNLTSQSDIDFHQSIIEVDPALGYQNEMDIVGLFTQTDLMHKKAENMTTNNFSFVFQKK